ncbi:hypothetical protein RRG08_062143 [Elysia crispata]|uniref:Uncharacterized protein n=1 Tax=Elysia crispata TaxID=231223 RepID=A0AAE1D1P1_9GAST|nr:hypothetical protein RRG08_062143 [Elysia crispata]
MCGGDISASPGNEAGDFNARHLPKIAGRFKWVCSVLSGPDNTSVLVTHNTRGSLQPVSDPYDPAVTT